MVKDNTLELTAEYLGENVTLTNEEDKSYVLGLDNAGIPPTKAELHRQKLQRLLHTHHRD